MSVEQSLLGQATGYPKQYAPEILFPIKRAESRQPYAHIDGITQGMDWWHAFELSWLDADSIPQVAIGRLHIPADSEFLIESKSLKLYFNSLNFKNFIDASAFKTLVEHDLGEVANALVKLELFDADKLLVSQPEGICLDGFTPSRLTNSPDASLLMLDQENAQTNLTENQFYSNLLRSNCPVTGQPDWGTVFIRYQGIKPCYSGLLAYIISYRQHSGFHEQCVEQIFADIWQHLQPKQLMVYAAYTRRGGLDINPCRVSDLSWLPEPVRLARQ